MVTPPVAKFGASAVADSSNLLHERGFRQVGPAREQLHPLCAQAVCAQAVWAQAVWAQAVCAEHDRDRVAEVRDIGEHVHLAELIRHRPSLGAPATWRQGQSARPWPVLARYRAGMGNRPRVTVLGSLNMDISVTVPRLPEPGATVLGSAARFTPGGKVPTRPWRRPAWAARSAWSAASAATTSAVNW